MIGMIKDAIKKIVEKQDLTEAEAWGRSEERRVGKECRL